MTTVKRLFVLMAGVALLGGCANYSGIVPEVSRFDSRALENRAAIFADWPKEEWWRSLDDPVLTDLIEHALIDSPSMQASSARLRRAWALTGYAESALWPQIGVSTSNTRERFSERGMIPPPYAGTTQSINDLQVSGQWEIDFFGRNQAALRAALGEANASEADRQAARQLLAATIARAYFNLARLVAQRDLAGERQRQRVDLAQLVKSRFEAGIDTKIELETISGGVPENLRDVAALDEQIGVARHLLATLTGRLPDTTEDLAPKLPESLQLAVPEALPANLLGHRADVAAARRRVEAATQSMDSTKALFYPNVNLRGFGGFSAVGLDKWFDSGNRQQGIGVAISLPIFDAGRLRSLYRVSAANLDESVAGYNGVLLEALRDVADQLSTLQSLEVQIERQRATLESSMRGYELVLQRYRADIGDRLSVLGAESALINQRRLSIDLRGRRIDTQIRLIHALGGGFLDAPALPSIAGTPGIDSRP